MSEHQLITPRRNFLIRALGFTAAGVTMPIPIVTLADAKARMEHHKAQLMRAWSDYYAGAKCSVQGNEVEPHYVHQDGGSACLVFYCSQEMNEQARRFTLAGLCLQALGFIA
ncbi:hypothetical protein [Bradyrhizobium sp. sBnM-33]|uniref:hypothetical protein n=1 Tax=Bradyrhizobium sp. sBnM-33 TaxID=2831780 RepID=UPI001BCDE000|nr:hypothetical protein [Bradyrhizobium sp. sBnM-33]WOH53829.1 hypothetical protein RX328_18095 [Bradyrhizobium sp. sBnM-33]